MIVDGVDCSGVRGAGHCSCQADGSRVNNSGKGDGGFLIMPTLQKGSLSFAALDGLDEALARSRKFHVTALLRNQPVKEQPQRPDNNDVPLPLLGR